jgi:hypothetical protein
MPLEISQLRPEGLPAAVDFAKAAGFECEADAVEPGVSLVARDGEAIVAAALGIRQAGSSFSLEVCLGKVENPASLTQELIDKALMKAKGAGVRRCQINYHGPDAVSSDWPGANWTGGTQADAESKADPATRSGAEAETKAQNEAEADAA